MFHSPYLAEILFSLRFPLWCLPLEKLLLNNETSVIPPRRISDDKYSGMFAAGRFMNDSNQRERERLSDAAVGQFITNIVAVHCTLPAGGTCHPLLYHVMTLYKYNEHCSLR